MVLGTTHGSGVRFGRRQLDSWRSVGRTVFMAVSVRMMGFIEHAIAHEYRVAVIGVGSTPHIFSWAPRRRIV